MRYLPMMFGALLLLASGGCQPSESPPSESFRAASTPAVDTIAFLADLDTSMKARGDEVLTAVNTVSTDVASIAVAQQRIADAIEILKTERAAAPDPAPPEDEPTPDSQPASSDESIPVFDEDTRPALWITYADGFACPPCGLLKSDIASGLLDEFRIVLEPTGEGLRPARPAIRFVWSTAPSGYAVIYEYSANVRQWLKTNLLAVPETASGVTPSHTTISFASTPVPPPARAAAQSQADLIALHNSLHGGGSWSWPGDLSSHLQKTHGVSLQTGGEPLTGSLFQNHRTSAVTSQRSRVANVSRGNFSRWWSGNSVRVKNSACPTCPR